jgi:hypothetical protein
MSGPELRLLDAARGATSRSEFVREALKPMVPAIQEGTPSSAGGPLVSLRQLERRLRRIETSARRRTAPIREVA